MKKISQFLVKYRIYIFITFIIFTVASVFLTFSVNINYDLTKYLPEDSSMKIGMTLMEDEFHDGTQSTLEVMIEGLEDTEITNVLSLIQETSNQIKVVYDTKSDYTLYTITIPDGAYSKLATQVYTDVNQSLEDYQSYLSGDVAEANSGFMLQLMLWSISLLLLVLVILSSSWIEPLIFIVTIGIAILINMGTNIIFSSVSQTTFSIAAILQLVLSMDYSIMLMERYRQEKEHAEPVEAMKNAISKGLLSISSSSITTIVGLLCLIFMSFTLGMDMGLVLAKGIFISLIVTFTVLPTFILMSDKLIDKTKKPTLKFRMKKVADFEFKFRHVLLVIFVILLAGSFYLSRNTNVDFALEATAKDATIINEKFPPDNQIVVLYDSKHEDKIANVLTQINALSGTKELNAYATTLGRKLTSQELSLTLGIDQNIIETLIYIYNNGDINNLTLNEFTTFVLSDIASNQMFASNFTQDDLAQLTMLQNFSNTTIISASYNSTELSSMLGIDQSTVEQLITGYYMQNGEDIKETISLYDFVGYFVTLSRDPNYSAMFDEATKAQVEMLYGIMQVSYANQTFSPITLAQMLGSMSSNFDDSILMMIFYMQAASVTDMSEVKISIDEFMTFMVNDLLSNDTFSYLFDEESKDLLLSNYQLIENGKAQLVGSNYSRAIISTSFSSNGEDGLDYINQVKQLLEDTDVTYHLIGELPMAYEMNDTFVDELNFVTLLTIIAIFVVVCIAFRSFFVPIVLVALIQTAIFVTMSSTIVSGSNLYFLAIIIIQAILMGAAIDYAILYTSYYRTARKTYGIKESMEHAFQGSMLAIMTSSIILIVITTVVGLVIDQAATAVVVLAIARGMTVAVVLTLFILPPVLAIFDKWICKEFGNPKNSKIA